MSKRRAIFLDRDGTVVKAVYEPGAQKEIRAPFSMDELEFAPNLERALDGFRSMGFLLIIITNQPDVAHGYLNETEWEKIHATIIGAVGPNDVFMCRHRSRDNCPLKKPSPLLILVAADKWGIDMNSSYMIGDTNSDMLAGKAVGCKTILLQKEYNHGTTGDFVVSDLLEALEIVKKAERIS